MLISKNIIVILSSVVLMLPICCPVIHILSHKHQHKFCKAVGEKHLHKLHKKCCNVEAPLITPFTSHTLSFYDKQVFLVSIPNAEPTKNTSVFIGMRSSRAPPIL